VTNVLGALLVFGAAACGLTLDFGERDSNGGTPPTDGGSRDADMRDGGNLGACNEYEAFGTPRKLGLDTDVIEWSPTISSDGLELIFVRSGEVESTGLRRALRRSRADDFTSDTLVDLDLSFTPDNPSLSRDGDTLFLDGYPTGTLVWAVDRRGDMPFGAERVVLSEPADTAVSAGPDISFDGTKLLLGTRDIYLAHLQPGGLFALDPAPIPVLGDASATEAWPAWGPNGTIVYQRDGDLFLATPQATGYAIAPIEELNTDSEESDPDMTPDGRTIVFVARTDGEPDLWIADRACAR
jgi:Tol biopolymer transport system component